MIKFKSKLALLAVPAVLAFAAVSYGSVVAFSTANPTPAPAQSEAAEPAEAAGDKAEANEPALPGGGYADADNVNADTQQEGIH
jgi:zona occludens toxin (predicted ATPase)